MENKKRYFKFIAGFFGIIAGVFILSNTVLWGWQKYNVWQENKAVEKRLAEARREFEKMEQEKYAKMIADTYGGKTPRETLQIFIDTVKKGDFELASKYFVFDKQDLWKEELLDIKQQDLIEDFIGPLLEAKNSKDYSESESAAAISKPVLVTFIKYPNNVWKITGI